METNSSSLSNIQSQIREACESLDLSMDVYEVLKEPDRVLEVSIPVRMDNGELKSFKGYRSQHNDALGPYKGGIRFNEDVDMDEVKSLSILMTLKCSLTGLPYGGGKGGIVVDPRKLSKGELERLSRGYVSRLSNYLGEKIDIPAPDVGSDAKIMAWMTDEFIKLKGHHELGVFTGKPVAWGGSVGREDATGIGIAITCKEAMKKLGIEVNGATAIVQGFGNVGSASVKHLTAIGVKIVAITERTKEKGMFGVYRESGFSYEELAEQKKLGKFDGLENIEIITEDEFWALDVDTVVVAALANAITEDNAHLIKAPLICEGANGPVSSEADKILEEKGIIVTPDILTNSGGVIVSYLEWVQNLYGYYWNEEKIHAQEEEKMKEAFENVWKTKEERGISFRKAAYAFSIERIAKVLELRGRI